MARAVRRIIILIVIFLVSLVVFSKITNKEVKDNSVEMARATYPVAFFDSYGYRINKMAGYSQEMNVLTMRYTVTPVPKDGVLRFVMENYDNSIDAMSFEVRSLDTTRLVQEDKVHFATGSNVITADLKIENILEPGREYSLTIKATGGDKEYNYYTRIIKQEESHVEECLKFANEFHNMTMDKELAGGLRAYMETSQSADNVSLQNVTINNTISQASWGSLKVDECTPVIASIKELNDSYNVILLNYIVSSKTENDEAEYYNVEEYYRVRYGKEKMYLLSFERTVEQIFKPVTGTLNGSELNLGIRSDKVDYKCNEAGNVVCFVQQGELWSYNTSSNIITKVFGFRGDEVDIRENNNEHDIRIIRAGESGNIDFIVYGYMNRGHHEGYVGISVCHYDCVADTVEELAFIPTTSSFQMMKEEMGQQMYISDKDIFYITMNNKTDAINLETKEVKEYIQDISDYYVISEDGRYIGWCSEDYKTFHGMDFETGETFDIEAPPGQIIKPLGYIGTDCIYGTTGENMISEATYGIEMVPLVKITIMDMSSGSIVKEYQEEGVFVTSTRIEDSNMYMDRVVRQGEAYVETEQNVIRNKELHSKSAVSVSSRYSDIKQKEIVFTLPKSMGSSVPELIESKLIEDGEPDVIDLGEANPLHDYYVYAKGRLLLATNSAARAVAVADDNRGVVIRSDQSYVWKRAKASKISFNMTNRGGSTSESKAINIILNAVGVSADVDSQIIRGASAYDVLNEAVDGRDVFNLTGCTLNQILYFVGDGAPAYSISSTGQPIVIAGYDDSTVSIYYPASDELTPIGLDLAQEKLAEAGNIFYVISK